MIFFFFFAGFLSSSCCCQYGLAKFSKVVVMRKITVAIVVCGKTLQHVLHFLFACEFKGHLNFNDSSCERNW